MYDLKLGKDVMKRYVSTVGGGGRYAIKYTPESLPPFHKYAIKIIKLFPAGAKD